MANKDTAAYTVDYDDPRLTAIKSEETTDINDVKKTYGDMIKGSDKFYDEQKKAAENYGKQQTEIANKNLELTIQGIEQDKAELKEDYTKEQSGAYVDWQKQSGAYGANAEKMAAAGLAGSGYSESSQVSMYNQYQSRVATARQSYVRAKADYDLAIADARNQNSSILAEIAYKTLQTKLQLSLEGFQYKNQLITELTDKKLAIKDSYWSRYTDTLNAIIAENKMRMENDQFNKSHDLQVKQYNETVRANKADEAYKNAVLALDKEKFAYTKSQDSKSSGGSSSKKSSGSPSNNSVKKNSTSKPKTSTASAYDYLNKLISSGATKDKVSNEIAIALREGAITKSQATKLRSVFTPRGLAY